ncbi:MAG: bifunctional demethylmenaquinone methyltransferase/2-methoxy-6-polyprenyl-1,4-benzoquinol methylase UbiE [Bacteroidales bacterium]|nr:bifunctional demethylmenaquinone methyltransferase/2-methoxy-6-polyprenyl-1,4-benzoquinol methylase UbiE [Bacteroidales bacterium]
MEGPKTEKIEALFNGIAGDYDRLNHLLSLGVDRSWRRRAMKEILPASSSKSDSWQVLDLACGTGDFSLEMAGKARRMQEKAARKGTSVPDIQITGLDLSEGMLEVMRRKVEKAGFAQSVQEAGRQVGIVALQGNAEALPFADGSFDRVTIAFGIRNFEQRKTALREILRVLKTGGRLVILELSVPSNPVLRFFYNLYFTHVLPRIGGWISGDKAAYRYLPASVLRFPGKEEWMETMRGCGFVGVRHRAYSLGICRQYVGERP